VQAWNKILQYFYQSQSVRKSSFFFSDYFETVGILLNLQTHNILIKISVKKRQFVKAWIGCGVKI
jgi:hypothetical protein